MNTLFYLFAEQLSLIKPYFPLPHGIPKVDDRRIILELAGFVHGRDHADQGVLMGQASVHRTNGHQGSSGFPPVCASG